MKKEDFKKRNEEITSSRHTIVSYISDDGVVLDEVRTVPDHGPSTRKSMGDLHKEIQKVIEMDKNGNFSPTKPLSTEG